MTDYQNEFLLPRRRLRFGRDFRPAPPITEEFEIDTDTIIDSTCGRSFCCW